MHTLGSDFPLHIAHKKISHLNEAGELVKPEEPNGYKFETLDRKSGKYQALYEISGELSSFYPLAYQWDGESYG